MIFSDTHKFVFLHNPKCGGMTIRKSLEPFDTTGLLFWGRHDFARRSTAKEHMPLHLFRQLFAEHFAKLASYFVFVFVRDPYARAVSAFNQHHDRQGIADLARTDPTQYRKRLNDFYAELGTDALSGLSVMNRHLLRQTDMIYLEGKCLADVILRIEAWDASLAQLGVLRPDLAAAIGGQRRVNVKPTPEPRQSYLEPRGIARINKLYRDDFLLFGYPMTEL